MKSTDDIEIPEAQVVSIRSDPATTIKEEHIKVIHFAWIIFLILFYLIVLFALGVKTLAVLDLDASNLSFSFCFL